MMETMMWALVKEKREKGLWLQQIPIPKVGAKEVMIKIHKTSICGTDLHIYNWDSWSEATIPTPMAIGHEYVGEIFEMGEDVTSFTKGEIVSGEGHIVCGKCRNCQTGMAHVCKNTVGVGVNRQGAFAEYLVIPEENVRRVPKGISEDVISCFDGLGNAVHTTLHYPVVGEDVLITGAGPIGIMATAVAKKAGARHVVVTDVNEYRLDLAKKMGATRVVNVAKEQLKDVVRELCLEDGFSVGLEMSGNGRAFNDMIDQMMFGGKIALLGIQAEDTRVDWDKIIFHGLTLQGIYGRQMYTTWHQMGALVEAGMDITPIITHRFHFTEFEKGFEVMNTGNSGKVVLDWTNQK